MTEGKDRLEVLRERVAVLAGEARELRGERTRQKRRIGAKSEAVRTDAETRLKSIEPELQDVERALARAEREHKLENARREIGDIFEAMKGEEGAELEVGGAGSPESDRAVAAALLDLARVRAMQNFLKGRAAERVDALRPFVLAYFKGYTRSDDPKKRYPAWFADAALSIAVLEDNPLYELTREQLIALVGLEKATAFFKVDYGAFEKAVRDGLVVDTEGQSIDLERLAEVRTRSERTPSLELKARGEKPIEEFLDLIDPKFAERGLTIDALGLDTATEGKLRDAGYTMVEQVRASFDTLQNIRGIGPKRAARIIDALVIRAQAAA